MTVDTIPIPTDGSYEAEAAAARSFALAAQLDGTVHSLSVADSGLDTLLPDDGGISDRLTEQADDHVNRVATTATDRDIECISETATGDPAEKIVEYVENNDLDMIVMGTHGRGGFQRAVVGSVTDEVIRTANVPVLSVRATGDAAERDEESQ